jgi:hypothetical protein
MLDDDKTDDILDEAARITSWDRNIDYGHPKDNHACTAELWNAYLARRTAAGSGSIDAEDVCILNILQKVSRHAWRRTRDNRVDIAGWARNGQIVDDAERAAAATCPTAEELASELRRRTGPVASLRAHLRALAHTDIPVRTERLPGEGVGVDPGVETDRISADKPTSTEPLEVRLRKQVEARIARAAHDTHL